MKIMKNLFTLALVISLGLISLNVSAQTATANHTLTMGIPEVCLLATGNPNVSLVLTTTTAGAQITGGTGTGYAQVSSIVGAAELRTIEASVTGVPAGTSLDVTTNVPSGGNSGGILGTGTSSIALVNAAAAVTLVTAIGSCYTGTANTDGYEFNYIWNCSVGSYGSIVATTGATATVVLTITNTP